MSDLGASTIPDLPIVILVATIKNSKKLNEVVNEVSNVGIDVLTERMNEYFNTALTVGEHKYTLNDYDTTFLSFILCLLYDFKPLQDYLVELLVELGEITVQERVAVSKILEEMSEQATNTVLGRDIKVIEGGQRGGGISIMSILCFLLSISFITYTVMYNRYQYFNPLYPKVTSDIIDFIGRTKEIVGTSIKDCGVISIPKELQIIAGMLEMSGLEKLLNSNLLDLYYVMMCHVDILKQKLYSVPEPDPGFDFNNPTIIFDYYEPNMGNTVVPSRDGQLSKDPFINKALSLVPQPMLGHTSLTLEMLGNTKAGIKQLFEGMSADQNALNALENYVNMSPEDFIKEFKKKNLLEQTQLGQTQPEQTVNVIEQKSQFQQFINTVSKIASIGNLIVDKYNEIADTSSEAFAVNLTDKILWTLQDYLRNMYRKMKRKRLDLEENITDRIREFSRIVANLNAFYNMLTMLVFLNTMTFYICGYYTKQLYQSILTKQKKIIKNIPLQQIQLELQLQDIPTNEDKDLMLSKLQSILTPSLGTQLAINYPKVGKPIGRDEDERRKAKLNKYNEVIKRTNKILGITNGDEVTGGYKRKQKNRTAKKIKRKTRNSKGRNVKGRNSKGRKSKRRNSKGRKSKRRN